MTAMPAPRSIRRLPSTSSMIPPLASATKTGSVVPTPLGTARVRRAQSSRERGPGISVRNIRRCSIVPGVQQTVAGRNHASRCETANVDHATMRQRMREARVGRLATVTGEGRPHVVPCCFVLAGDAAVVYSAVDGKPKSTLQLRRLANIRANPYASLLVDHYADDWSALWWVRV